MLSKYLQKKVGIGLAILIFLPFFIKAQELRKLSGSVIDESNKEPLVGAIVKVQGTNRNVVTSVSGGFQISAKTGEVLEVSYMGYKTHTVRIGASSNYNIAMKLDERSLSEVVVIGYGAVAKPDLTGAVSQVKLPDLEKAPVGSFEQALQGRVAGVVVSSTDGQPGDAMNIVIRGGNSLTQSNAPLYVIDGFPVEDASNLSINPDDIESMNILKDASSTSIYGARGANGVIVIETKKGKVGAPVVTFNNTIGLQTVQKTIDMMSPYEFVKYQIEMDPVKADQYYLAGYGKTLEDYKNIEGIDWQDEIFRTSLNRIHNIGVRGGNTQTKYSISGSIYSQNGIILNSDYDRYQGRITLDQTVNKKLNVGINVNISRRIANGTVVREGDVGNTITSNLLTRAWAYRPVTGSGVNLLEEEDDDEVINQYDARFNPVSVALNASDKRRNTDISTNAYLQYKFTPALTFKSVGTMYNATSGTENFYSSKTPQGTSKSYFNSKGVNAYTMFGERLTLSNNSTLTYNKTYNKAHKFTAMGGVEFQSSQYKAYSYSTQQIPNEELGMAGMDQGNPLATMSTFSEYSLFSLFGRLDYNYKSKYIFTATMRSDASSKFSNSNRWGYFPAVAAAWNMHTEKWFKDNMPFVSSSKLRISYGLNGNNRVSDYTRFLSLDMPISSAYSWGNSSPTVGGYITSLPNRNLKWETTESMDLGWDLSFFKGKLDFVIDLYRKNTRDLLLNANIAPSSGYSVAYKNVGSVRNEGIEFTVSSINLKTRKFSWTTDFNISFNRNKVLALNEAQERLFNTPSFISQYSTNPLYISEIGKPVGLFYGFIWEGTYKQEDFNGTILKPNIAGNGDPREQIQPGDIKYKDLNGDGTIDAGDLTIIGRGLPIHTGGLNNNLNYKNFSFNVFFQWSYGNDVYNANRLTFDGNGNERILLNQYASYIDRWSPENPTSNNYRARGQGPYGYHSTRVLEDGSYIRLKTVSLEYSIPFKYIKYLSMSKLDLGVAGQNLYTWTRYSGMDPEVSTRNVTLMPGFDYSGYPLARTMVFSLKATF
ncbi:TonB-dependent receptor plug [Pseudopedobacter saltans DSM 12145]|uniref:TonB-dependent receptor plug n=1 Tax=Pseudopedobacter saltans (strain ATCC 51119 / DSM 12145 / JCM 21818 / CCUG 39354 / LMG 10337 / NBRC 100064 / NCIMB 13643) TaxID=762903 RepID=F0S836_PSESL|nr:TonB-dependent receptor [Pseudopedobacter saltans]ADY51257.1 TonB-dependent receptor plug [Pseudopedobacter saltans DSM 12145]